MKGNRALPSGAAPARGTPTSQPRHTLWGDSKGNPACPILLQLGGPQHHSPKMSAASWRVQRPAALTTPRTKPAALHVAAPAIPELPLCQGTEFCPGVSCGRAQLWVLIAGPGMTPVPPSPPPWQQGCSETHGLSPTLPAPPGFTHLRGCCQDVPTVTSILLLQLREASPALQGAQGEERQIFPLGGKVQFPQRAGGFLQDHHDRQRAAAFPVRREPHPGGTTMGGAVGPKPLLSPLEAQCPCRGDRDIPGWHLSSDSRE